MQILKTKSIASVVKRGRRSLSLQAQPKAAASSNQDLLKVLDGPSPLDALCSPDAQMPSDYKVPGEILNVRDLNGQLDGNVLRPTHPELGARGGFLQIQAQADALPRFDVAPTFHREVGALHSTLPLLFTNNPQVASVAAHEFGMGAITLLPGGSNMADIGQLQACVVDLENDLNQYMEGRGLHRLHLFVFDAEMGVPVVGYDGLTWLMQAALKREWDVAALYLTQNPYQDEPALQRLRAYLSTVRGI